MVFKWLNVFLTYLPYFSMCAYAILLSFRFSISFSNHLLVHRNSHFQCGKSIFVGNSINIFRLLPAYLCSLLGRIIQFNRNFSVLLRSRQTCFFLVSNDFFGYRYRILSFNITCPDTNTPISFLPF